MRAIDRATYIIGCLRDAGSMYLDDAAQFLADHDAHTRALALVMAADLIDRDDTCRCGGCDTCTGRALAARIRALAGKDIDAAQAPADESTQPAAGTCGRARSTGQPCPDHPFVPRTEREYWVDIADALNAAAAADIHIGIDMNGSALTDFSDRSIVYDRPTARWLVVCTDCDRPLNKACGHCPECEACLDCGSCSGTGCTCKCEVPRG